MSQELIDRANRLLLNTDKEFYKNQSNTVIRLLVKELVTRLPKVADTHESLLREMLISYNDHGVNLEETANFMKRAKELLK
jgi:hypothetical protein